MAETQIVQKQTSAISTLRDLLEKSKSKFQDVIPKHLSADRLVRVAIVACSRTPKLLLCTPVSVLNSVMQAAQLGL
jgi:recombination protein RecT